MMARPKSSERGYALLFVFLMAGSIALMLYKEMPRVAFESEREKEQLLIDRGQQYVRAIQLYYVANRKFPLAIEDLENRDKRFLRRRYIDPYTGKDEWRLIHGTPQALTDSLVQVAPTADPNSTTTTQQTPTTTNADGTPAVNAAVLARPSDRPLNLPPGVTYVSGDANNANVDPRNQPLPPITLTPPTGNQQNQQIGTAAPGQALPPITLTPGIGTPGAPGNGALPPITLGFTPPGGAAAANGGRGGVVNPQGAIPGVQAGGAIPGLPGLPGGFRIDANGQPVAITAPNPGSLPGVPGQGQPGQLPNQPGDSSAALNIINQILTSPRAPAPTTAPVAAQNTTFGVGIAGVASTHTGPSIKVYNDQSEYELWEFVYQATNAGAGGGLPGGGGGPGGGGPGGGGGPNGRGGGPNNGNPGGFNPGGFTPPGGGGNGGGFGNGGFGNGGAGGLPQGGGRGR